MSFRQPEGWALLPVVPASFVKAYDPDEIPPRLPFMWVVDPYLREP